MIRSNIDLLSSHILPKEIVIVEDVVSDASHSMVKRSDNDGSNNDGNDNPHREVKDPERPESCKTKRDRYSWRKWVRLWREVQLMNRKKRTALENLAKGGTFREDRMLPWTPTWKKRKGDLWVLDLLSFQDELDRWEEREMAKTDWGGRPPTVDFNTDENSSFWSDMSDPKQVYSSDESYDSGEDYDSDF